uniref:MFSD2 lysolipid transporter B, sphingolipid n=1 Tax=Paramormyrops kingsleyae TaxID=1676925 RepID=A0A3B3RJ40_9TELE
HLRMKRIPDQRLSVFSKLCFAIGGAPIQIAGSATGFFLQIYLLDVAQISPFQASVVLFVGKVWGAVSDPVIGFFISKSRWTKIGRLMPWYVLPDPEGSNAVGSRRNISKRGSLWRSLGDAEHHVLCFPPPKQKELYMIAAGVIAALFLLCTVVMLLGVKEKEDPYALGTEKPIPFHKGFYLVMRHGPYLTLTGGFLFITVAIQLVQSNFILFCMYAADLRDHFQNIVLTILLSAAISIPFWQWFLQRFGKKTAAYCGISSIIPFIILLVLTPHLTVAYVVAVSSGLSVAASLLLPWSMLPDVVDDFRLMNPFSKGHEAIFYSFYVFFTKFAAGISLGVSTLCLEFAGYLPRVCQQHPLVAYTLKLLIGMAPVAFIIMGLVLLLLYPINEKVRISPTLTVILNKVRAATLIIQ